MRYCVLILSAFLVLSSCTKVEELVSKQEQLRAEKWSLDAQYVHKKWKKDGASVPATIDEETKVDIAECAKDDLLVFREGYEGAHIPGENTCSINETAEIGFRWGLTDNDTRMFIYDANEFFKVDVNAEIIEFYADKFAIRFSEYQDKAVAQDGKPTTWLRDTTTYTMYFKKFVPKPVE